MADGKVQYQFLADTNQAERNLARLEKRLDDQERKLKQVSRTSRKGAADQNKTFQKAIGNAAKLVAGYVGIQSAVRLTKAAYDEWANSIREATAAERTFNQGLIKTLTLTGDLAQGRQIRERLQNISGLTDEQGAAAFDAVTGAAPQLSLDKRLRLVEATQPAAPLLTTVDDSGKIQGLEELGKFNQLVADLSEVSPGKIPDDLADLATAVRAALGKFSDQASSPGFEKLMKTLVARGFSPEESAALGVEQFRSGGRATTLANAIAKLPQDVDAPAFVASTLADENREQAEKLLGKEGIAEFDRIRPEEFLKLQKTFTDAQTQNLLAAEVRRAEKVDPIAFIEQRNAAALEKSLRPQATSERQLEAVASFRTSQAETFFQSMSAGVLNTLDQISRLKPGVQDFSVSAEAVRVLQRDPGNELAESVVFNPIGGVGRQMVENRFLNAQQTDQREQTEILRQQVGLMQRQAETLERLANQPAAPAPPRPLRRGAHTEAF